MKDVRMQISMHQADIIINGLMSRGYDVEEIPGGLLDNYFCEIGNNTLKLGRYKMRKYMMIVERYVNEWTSALELILTDSVEKFESTFNAFNGRKCDV